MSALIRIALASAIVITLGTLASATRQPAFAEERVCFNGTPVECDYTVDWSCEAKLVPVPFAPYWVPTISCSLTRRASKWWAAEAGNEANDRYVQPGTIQKQLPTTGSSDDAGAETEAP
jgi:hypothetical protein